MHKATPTVLVVDDEEELRGLAEIVLTEYGCTVLAVASAEEALRVLDGDFLRIDLLFSDVMMPGMSGFTLARRARQLRPELMIVLTTGYVTPAVAAAISDGGHRVLPKPYRPAQLIHAIRDEFAKKALTPPSARLDAASDTDSEDDPARQATGKP